MTTRRHALIAVLAAPLAWPCRVLAQSQPSQRIYRIALLSPGGPTPFIAAFVKAMHELGYDEGRNLVLERRYAKGDLDLLPGFATELVKMNPDVIVTLGSRATLTAQKATATIPIVFPANSDPVGIGLVKSLARPGGNVTGTALMAPDLSAKRLELLQALLPRILRLAILWDSSNPGMALRVRETEAAATQSRIDLRSVGPRNVEELESAFVELEKLRPDALLVTVEPFTLANLPRIVNFCNRNRVPTMFEESTYVERGGLMSYGPDLLSAYQRAAVYVDRILKGAKPAELPVELPSKFDLVINVKTAAVLGLTIPPSLLLRADRIIE